MLAWNGKPLDYGGFMNWTPPITGHQWEIVGGYKRLSELSADFYGIEKPRIYSEARISAVHFPNNYQFAIGVSARPFSSVYYDLGIQERNKIIFSEDWNLLGANRFTNNVLWYTKKLYTKIDDYEGRENNFFSGFYDSYNRLDGDVSNGEISLNYIMPSEVISLSSTRLNNMGYMNKNSLTGYMTNWDFDNNYISALSAYAEPYCYGYAYPKHDMFSPDYPITGSKTTAEILEDSKYVTFVQELTIDDFETQAYFTACIDLNNHPQR